MLDHTKPYIEKIHHIDVELAGYVYELDLKLRSLYGSGFSLFAVRVLAKPLEWIDQQHFAKTKLGYISLLWNLNAIIGILCNSANDGIAWCNKNNSEWGLFFFKNKDLFFL